MQETALFWFRRDLRLKDNHGLFQALKSGRPVTCIYIFDTNRLSQLEKNDARITFIHNTLSDLKKELEEYGSTLDVRFGDPVKIFPHLIRVYNFRQVFANHDYDSYSTELDHKVRNLLMEHSIKFRSFKDHVIFEKNEIIDSKNEPYVTFDPYFKKWKKSITFNKVFNYKSEFYLKNLFNMSPIEFPTINQIGFEKSKIEFNSPSLSLSTIKNYDKTKTFPGIKNGTSRIGIHLRYGTISVRECVNFALSHNDSWLTELIWRDFYNQILFHFPHIENSSFKKSYDKIKWENNEELFQKWCEGNTGYPLVDAGMRELKNTGYMHSQIRIIVSSFLCKNLRIDWRWGERYFSKHLLDFDLASNIGGWQGAAGSGVESTPYFQVSNPLKQTHSFDPQLTYIKKWVPEFKNPDYPKPIVDFIESREICFKMYKKAIIK